MWVSETHLSFCSVVLQVSQAYAHRSAKTQPGGSFVGSGIMPGIGFSFERLSIIFGRELNNPSV